MDTRKLKVGPPKDADTNLGALVSKEHLTKVGSLQQMQTGEQSGRTPNK